MGGRTQQNLSETENFIDHYTEFTEGISNRKKRFVLVAKTLHSEHIHVHIHTTPYKQESAT